MYFWNCIKLKETQREPEADVELAVYLINKVKIVVNIKSYDQTEDVLEVNIRQKF